MKGERERSRWVPDMTLLCLRFQISKIFSTSLAVSFVSRKLQRFSLQIVKQELELVREKKRAEQKKIERTQSRKENGGKLPRQEKSTLKISFSLAHRKVKIFFRKYNAFLLTFNAYRNLLQD